MSKVKACVDVSRDRTTAWISFAGWRADGRPQVEVVAKLPGVDGVEAWLKDPKRADRIEAVTGQTRGAPVSGLMKDLKVAGLPFPVEDWGSDDLAGWTGAFYDLVSEGRMNDDGELVGLRHLPQPALDLAAANTVFKPLGDRFVADRARSPVDAAPLVSAIGAIGLLTRREAEPPPPPPPPRKLAAPTTKDRPASRLRGRSADPATAGF